MIFIKKYALYMLAVLAIAFPVMQSSATDTTTSESLEVAGAIEDWTTTVTDIWDRMQTIEADAIFDELDLADQQLQQLETTVASANDLLSILTPISDAFSAISERYANIAGMTSSIESQRAGILNEMTTLLNSVDAAILDKEAERDALVDEKMQLETELITETDPTNQTTLQNSITALESQIASKQQVIDRYTDFDNLALAIEADLIDYNNDIIILLSALNDNAGVYDAAAESIEAAAELAEADAAIDGLTQLTDLGVLTGTIVNNWGDINQLVDDLNNV